MLAEILAYNKSALCNNECEKKLKEDEKDGETMPARLQHVLMASLRAMGAL